MVTIKIDKTQLLMVNCGVPEYSEAGSKELTEEELAKIAEENIECVIELPVSAKDYK